ncbi:hypothetical protein T08_4666 [Trichinella sp. T8]|nr:hypothetical protein T08_4666 [Trichinella sp. T8]
MRMIFTLLLDHDHMLFNLRAVNVMLMLMLRTLHVFSSMGLCKLADFCLAFVTRIYFIIYPQGRSYGWQPILMAPCHSCSTDAEILNKAHYV